MILTSSELPFGVAAKDNERDLLTERSQFSSDFHRIQDEKDKRKKGSHFLKFPYGIRLRWAKAYVSLRERRGEKDSSSEFAKVPHDIEGLRWVAHVY